MAKQEVEEMGEENNSLSQDWKTMIMGVNSKSELDYIRSLCDARMSLARADWQLDRPKPKKGDKAGPYIDSYDPPEKLKPVVLIEEDPEKII